jgi:hypothetical protein
MFLEELPGNIVLATLSGTHLLVFLLLLLLLFLDHNLLVLLLLWLLLHDDVLLVLLLLLSCKRGRNDAGQGRQQCSKRKV